MASTISGQERRKLAAILAADVVGYSRFMEADEAAALSALRRVRAEVVDPAVEDHGGRVVKTSGDGLLIEFGSAVSAVRCALAIQNALAASSEDIRLRIGVNVGDVVIEDGDIFGDGVNLAARLEGHAEAGEVVISDAVRDYLRGRIDERFSDEGAVEFKNIGRPVRVWRWTAGGGEKTAQKQDTESLELPDKPSIVVLPFDNMSGDAEQDYFADGVVEAITAALSRISAFFVIARNSAFAYKGRSVNVKQIGKELGVAYVLEGSVQRAGQKVRITVQLIETANGSHLWAEKYDGSIDDIFDLQDQITEKIAGALLPSIRQAEVERARRKPPQNMGAYDFTMRAFSHVWKLEKEEADRALELLDEALARDPEYPLALALAAWCWAQKSVYNWDADIEGVKAKALSLADTAASRSTEDPLVLAILGTVNTIVRNYGSARVLLERALALDPNSAWTLSRLGWLEVYTDNPEPARAYFEKALRLSPLDQLNFNNYVGLGSAHQVAGDYQKAADCFIRALEERPSAHWIHRSLAGALYADGREDEARESVGALMENFPDLTTADIRKAMVFSPAELDKMCARLEALGVPKG